MENIMNTRWSDLLTEEQIAKLEALSEEMNQRQDSAPINKKPQLDTETIYNELASIAQDVKKSGMDSQTALTIIKRIQKVAIYVKNGGQL